MPGTCEFVFLSGMHQRIILTSASANISTTDKHQPLAMHQCQTLMFICYISAVFGKLAYLSAHFWEDIGLKSHLLRELWCYISGKEGLCAHMICCHGRTSKKMSAVWKYYIVSERDQQHDVYRKSSGDNSRGGSNSINNSISEIIWKTDIKDHYKVINNIYVIIQISVVALALIYIPYLYE